MAFSLFGSGRRRQNKRLAEERQQLFAEADRPGLAQQLKPFKGKDPWTEERLRRRKQVQDKYWSDKKKLTHQRQQAERDLKKQLERRQVELQRYYERKGGSRRAGWAEQRATQVFDRESRHAWQKHREQWRGQLHELQKGRSHQYKDISKSMRKEARESRLNLPPRLTDSK